MSDTIQVAIVDDHTLFREGLAHILAAESDIDVVAQGASAADAIRLAADLLPDLILLDITMPGGGIAAAQTIARSWPVTKIVMLTGSEDEDHLVEALKAGARGYILKGISARELITILRGICAGEVYITPALAASLLLELTNAPGSPRTPPDPLDDLTGRERQILEGVAAGLSNREIGQQLHLSEKTVKHYMTNILHKLHVRNRVEAALLVQRGAKR